MVDPFKKVVFLPDEFSTQLAKDTHKVLGDYSKIKRLRIPGGLREFYPSDLVTTIQRNGELTPEIKTTVRGRDVYVFVSPVVSREGIIVYDANVPIMRACLIADACREAGADRINLVMPHMPYQRQDRRTTDKKTGAEKREPISARLTLSLLQAAGYKQLVTVDPHFQQYKGFIPRGMYTETPTSRVALTSYLQRKFNPEGNLKFGVVSPDFGGGERAEITAKDLESLFLGLCRKRRPRAGVIGDMKVYFEEGIKPSETELAIIYDDIADSCGTMEKCARALKALGIPKIIGVAAHPVFSDGAMERLYALNLTKELNLEMVVSNSIPLTNPPSNIHVVDISTILGVTLHCITTGHGSLTQDIFDPKRYQKLEQKLKEMQS